MKTVGETCCLIRRCCQDLTVESHCEPLLNCQTADSLNYINPNDSNSGTETVPCDHSSPLQAAPLLGSAGLFRREEVIDMNSRTKSFSSEVLNVDATSPGSILLQKMSQRLLLTLDNIQTLGLGSQQVLPSSYDVVLMS